MSLFISGTGSFGTSVLEAFAGGDQFLSFEFGPAQCPVAVFSDLEAALRLLTIAPAWAGVDRDEPAFGEPAQRQVNMADRLASGPLVDHCRNAFQRAPVAQQRDRRQNLKLALLQRRGTPAVTIQRTQRGVVFVQLRLDALPHAGGSRFDLLFRGFRPVALQNLIHVHLLAFHCVPPGFDMSFFSLRTARCRFTATPMLVLPSSSAISLQLHPCWKRRQSISTKCGSNAGKAARSISGKF